MEPNLSSSVLKLQPLVPQEIHEDGTLILKGSYLSPVAYRIFEQREREPIPAPLSPDEVKVLAIIDDRQCEIALNVRQLALDLKLSVEKVKKSVQKYGILDVEKLYEKKAKYKQQSVQAGVSLSTLATVKKVAKALLSQVSESHKIAMQSLPESISGGRDISVLVSALPDQKKAETLIMIKEIGLGATGQVSKWLNLKTYEQVALKLPISLENPHKEQAVEEEGHFLLKISKELQAKGEISVGLQLPPHTTSRIKVYETETPLDALPSRGDVETVGFISRLYRGDLNHNDDALSLEQRVEATKQLTHGLHLLHDVLGRVHGDIKLANIFVDLDLNHFCLADFGDGKTSEERVQMSQEYFSSPPPGISFRDFLIKSSGVSSFFPADDLKGIFDAGQKKDWVLYQDIKKAVDVYALGISFLFLFNKNVKTTHRPFKAMSVHMDDWIQEIRLANPSPLANSGLPLDKQELIMRMLDPDWRLRPSASELEQGFNPNSS